MAINDKANSQQLKKEKNTLLIKTLCNDPDYKIHEDGTILTLIQKTGKRSVSENWRTLIHDISSDGYAKVRYKYKYLQVHRVVFQKFVGDLNPHLQINHKDGNRLNNHFSNLEQVTQSENMIHSFRVLKRKPSIGYSKINEKIALFVRVLSKSFLHKDIAEVLKISESTVSYIVNKKTWNRGGDHV